MVEIQIFDWLKQYWYVILLVAVTVIVIFLILFLKDKKKKREYYSEIARQKEIIEKELEYNKSDYKYLVLRNGLGEKKTLGRIVGYRTDNISFDLPHLTEEDRKEPMRMKEFYLVKSILNKAVGQEETKLTFSIINICVKTQSIGLGNIRFWFGKKEIFITEKDYIHLEAIRSEMICDDDIGFRYQNGKFISTKGKIDEWYNEYDVYRLIHDHTINAFAYQQLRFAEIKDEYAQAINLKEKEAELEERKRKTLLERS